MTKKEKEMIAKAVPHKSDKFCVFYVINSGKRYDGFWGENGYNNIIVLGEGEGGELELLTNWSDVIHIFNCGVNIDIPNDTGVIRLFTDAMVELPAPVYSALILDAERR